MNTNRLKQLLEQVWGYADFRPGQEEIISHILSGNDAIALLPTGGGKSVCYQVPGLAFEGCTVVVSPLISLMEDQVQDLTRRNIPALCLAGDIDPASWDKTMDRAIAGDYSFLYISPERALSSRFLSRIPYLNVRLLAIDEAHCASQWGHDFRPSYTSLGRLRQACPGIPCIAVTASATPHVLKDIQNILGLEKAKCFQQSFDRPNLSLHVHPTRAREELLMKLLEPKNGRQIIYTRSRSLVTQWAQRLTDQGIPALPYHAGMPLDQRSKNQAAWSKGVARVMVATNAFGMGIDQGDVRQVFHLDIPDSPESYYQEIGRAGRDGKPAAVHFLLDKRVAATFDKRITEERISWEDLSKVYNLLGSVGQVAAGDGLDFRQTIDIENLAERLQQSRRWVERILDTLQREGLFTLNDSWKARPQLALLLSGERLLSAASSLPAHAETAFLLARQPGILLNKLQPFSPKRLSAQLGLSLPHLYNSLNRLQEAGILEWEHQESKTMMTWRLAREREGYMPISRKKIQDLLTHQGERADAMRSFLHTTECRMAFLLKYFGEEKTKACRRCDRCTQSSPRGTLALQAHMYTLLENGPYTRQALGLQLKDETEAIDAALRDGIVRNLWSRNPQGTYSLL